MPFHLRARFRVGLSCLGLIAGLGLSSVHASAQPAAPPSSGPVEEARTRFTRGVDLYKEGDFRAAIIEFKRAYDLAPNFRVLFNIGQAYQELQNYAAALDAFERYLKDGGAEVPPERAEQVKAEVEKLLGRVASVKVKANVTGATVSVDDVSVGTTPMSAPVRISAGRRKITVSKAGFQSSTQDIDFAGRDQKELELKLVEAAGAPQPAKPEAPKEKPASKGMGTGFWVGIGVTAALAASAGVAGFYALRAKSDHEDKLDTLGTTKSELDDSRKKVRNLALTADILAGSALVAGTVTVIFATGSSGEKTGMRVGPSQAALFGTF